MDHLPLLMATPEPSAFCHPPGSSSILYLLTVFEKQIQASGVPGLAPGFTCSPHQR
eukprot:m.293641 g.293641  ORF g.293641 m.293641 type:complete len:56 (-) comp27793_c0_seq1:218-385(-)